MKENSAHSFSEGHHLSEKEKKEGLKLAKAYGESFKTGEWFETIRIDAYQAGFNSAAEKANSRIAELEKERDKEMIRFALWCLEQRKLAINTVEFNMITMQEPLTQFRNQSK